MILCVLHNPETSHFPETGFVYNSIEASICSCLLILCELRGRERGCATRYAYQYWAEFQAPGFRQLTSEDRGFICLSAQLKHENERIVESSQAALPVWQDLCWLFPSIKCQAYDAGQRTSTCQTGSPLRSLCTTRYTASIHQNCLCWFFCLPLQCRSVHRCHLVLRKRFTRPEVVRGCTGIKVNRVVIRFSGFNQVMFNTASRRESYYQSSS